jgi:hypothetical protein
MAILTTPTPPEFGDGMSSLLMPMLEKPVDANLLDRAELDRGTAIFLMHEYTRGTDIPVMSADPVTGWATSDFLMIRPLASAAQAIGETLLLETDLSNPALPMMLLTIERDNEEAETAAHKKLFVDSFINGHDENLVMSPKSTEVADLLDLADPDDLDGDGKDRFRFPYLTIESVAVVDERTVIVCNDNNYPFTDGRPERAGPDATEFILIRFDRPLAELAGTIGNEARP